MLIIATFDCSHLRLNRPIDKIIYVNTKNINFFFAFSHICIALMFIVSFFYLIIFALTALNFYLFIIYSTIYYIHFMHEQYKKIIAYYLTGILIVFSIKRSYQ